MTPFEPISGTLASGSAEVSCGKRCMLPSWYCLAMSVDDLAFDELDGGVDIFRASILRDAIGIRHDRLDGEDGRHAADGDQSLTTRGAGFPTSAASLIRARNFATDGSIAARSSS